MSESTVRTNGIDLAYETFGRVEDPPLVLVMGLGVQMLGWDQRFCEGLADRGHHVIRFDNRDVGHSTHLHGAPRPNVLASYFGDHSSASYTLDDMADDTAGLIVALGLDSAHLVGVSLGGMIAQMVAVRHPERVRSLASVMSTTGAMDVGQPNDAARAVLLMPPGAGREATIERAVAVSQVTRSPGFAFDEDALRLRARQSWDRDHDPLGAGRQLVAILASGDRTAALEGVAAPTVVVHGRSDPLIASSGGEATAKAIPGAELDLIDGMGHDLPMGVWERLYANIARAVQRGEDARAAGWPTDEGRG